MKIGIIGQGFVGSAIREGLVGFYDIVTYDIDPTKCNSTHTGVCQEADIIFVCVPTPMRKTGECDTSILEKAIAEICDACATLGDAVDENPIIVIKSTIPPGTTERIAGQHPEFSICFSPEFLTEANSFDDFKNQTRIIVGGPRPATGKVKQAFRRAFPTIPIIKTGTKTAEMVKYFINCFLATKVTFANEMYDICVESDIDMDKVTEYALHDQRIGSSHLTVPGPDGDRGFGGHCFPKDLSAMIFFGTSMGVSTDFLESVERKNDSIRTNRDWELMPGRAVSDE